MLGVSSFLHGGNIQLRSKPRDGVWTALLLLGILPGLWVDTAMANPDRISLLLGSHHFSSEDFEEFNPGLFVSWLTSKRDLEIGLFRNSYGNLSVSATAGRRLGKSWTLFAGTAYYRNADTEFEYRLGKFIPVAGVQFVHRNLFVKALPGVVVAGFTWRLGE